MYKFLYALLLISTVQQALGIDLTKENLNHQINPYADILLTYQINSANEGMNVYFKLKPGPGKQISNFTIQFYAQPQYVTINHRNITDAVNIDTLSSKVEGNYFKVFLPNVLIDTLVIAAITDITQGKSYYFDIPLLLGDDYPVSDISIFQGEKIVLDDYVVGPITVNGAAKSPTIHAYFYNYSFPPANPPMTLERFTSKGTFKIDSTFSFQSRDSVLLVREGLYLFQTDTASLIAKPLLVLTHNFPKYTNLEKLMESTRYITSANEYRNVNTRKNKDAFDELWLTMTGSSTQARTAIRLFYQRIEEANAYFTSYKEGWKTDTGMIYTVFGTPDELTKGQDYQLWKYYGNEERAEITFTFVKIKDIFSRSHFELVRNSKYGNAWLKTVEKWRKGK